MKAMFRTLVISSLLAALWGCASVPRLGPDVLRAAPYRLASGAPAVTFTDGGYDRDSVRFGQIDLVAYGDLDGDGVDDAVTFLSEKGPGPEIYISIEAFLDRDGRPVHAARVRLGDRIAIESVEIHHRTILLGLITQGPDDAPCCPTLHVRRALRLEGGELSFVTP